MPSRPMMAESAWGRRHWRPSASSTAPCTRSGAPQSQAMHELSIAMSIIEMAEEEADNRGVQIDAVHLKLGALSGVAKDALLSCFEMACENTRLQGSRLVIEEVPVVILCARCPARHPLS